MNNEKLNSTSKSINKIDNKDNENEDFSEDYDEYNNDDLIITNNYEEIENEDELMEDDEKNLIEKSLDYKSRIKKSGVMYLTYVPEGLKISLIRKKLDKYGVNRIYLRPVKGKLNVFKDGWIEFRDKLMAKLCEFELNGRPIGGKKRDPLRDELWNFKYLHKFKWHHLVEKMHLSNKIKEQEIATSLNQANRENMYILESYKKSFINKKRQKEENMKSSISNASNL